MISGEKEKQIKELFYVYKRTKKDIARETELPYAVIDKFLTQDKLKNYSDKNIENLARTEDYNSLSVVNTFFDSAGHAAQELAFTALVAKMLREKIASILAEKGVDGLLENNGLLKIWYDNTEKLTKLTSNAPKYLDAYINLYTQVLDIQRSVSYVKVVNDVLAKADARLHKIIKDALERDSAARAVFASLKPEEIAEYWADELSIPGRALSKKIIDVEVDAD